MPPNQESPGSSRLASSPEPSPLDSSHPDQACSSHLARVCGDLGGGARNRSGAENDQSVAVGGGREPYVDGQRSSPRSMPSGRVTPLVIAIFFVAHWQISVFFQTFFLHRYGAHRMFTMSKGWERFFHLCTYMTQGSSYLCPRAYAILHRMHHAYS